jgi:purine-binding chemotaxis protein CheW
VTSSRYVCARANELRVAFAIDEVQEVLAPRAVTPLFHTPPQLLGVIGLRGDILPVLDLASLLSGAPPRASEGADARFVVLRVTVEGQSKPTSFAMRVARLEPLRDAGTTEISPLPPGVPEGAARFARGMVTEPAPAVLVMDPGKIIELEELAALAGARG